MLSTGLKSSSVRPETKSDVEVAVDEIISLQYKIILLGDGAVGKVQ